MVLFVSGVVTGLFTVEASLEIAINRVRIVFFRGNFYRQRSDGSAPSRMSLIAAFVGA